MRWAAASREHKKPHGVCNCRTVLLVLPGVNVAVNPTSEFTRFRPHPPARMMSPAAVVRVWRPIPTVDEPALPSTPMLTAAQWKRAVQPTLPPVEQWSFRGKLAYPRPVDWVLPSSRSPGHPRAAPDGSRAGRYRRLGRARLIRPPTMPTSNTVRPASTTTRVAPLPGSRRPYR